MWMKILIGVVVIVGLFLIYVSTRESRFRYEVSGFLAAPVEKVFPYISDLKKGGEWSPYEKMDPNMKKNYQGSSDQAGGKMTFEGNKDVGSGSLEILKIVPNQKVDLRLIMTSPFHADNLVEYTVAPEAEGTRFTWSMSGDSGFMGKLISVVIDCNSMIEGQFKQGIENLKTIVETKKSQ